MKTAKKVWLLAAASLVAVGLVLCIVVLALHSFDLFGLSGAVYEEKSQTVTAEVEDIRIFEVDCDVSLLPAPDGVLRVVSTDSDRIFHTVTCEDGTLSVTREDSLAWYERIVFFGYKAAPVSIYLPDELYDTLSVETVSGKIDVAPALTFSALMLHSTSGNITCAADADEVKTGSVSGTVTVRGVTGGSLSVKTVSGNMTLSDIAVGELTVHSTSGEVRLTEVNVHGETEIGTTSGNIRFDRVTLARAELKTVSGNVRGTLCSHNDFDPHTTSGSIKLPTAGGDGHIRMETVSGNIDLTAAE